MRLLLIVLVLPFLCRGQGSGSVATPPDVSGSDTVPFLVTKSITGTILEYADGKIVIDNSKRKFDLKVDASKIKFAGKDKALGLKPGQRVRAVYSPVDMTLRNIRILTTEAAKQ